MAELFAKRVGLGLPSPVTCIKLQNHATAAYEELSAVNRAKYRHAFGNRLIQDFMSSPQMAIDMVSEAFGCENQQVARVFTALIRELLIQPMASSWAILKNMETKYGMAITVPELQQYYQVLQSSKIVQDMIRYNSSATKVIAVARGVLSTTLGTTYYLDVQTTDACPSRCTKCWRFYEDEAGVARLVRRIRPAGSKMPDFDDFKAVVKQVIDLGVEQLSSTGGGEPMMNPRLPELFQFAKAYARSLGRELRTFVPSCGLGVVFQNEDALRRTVNSLDNLRFSVDSFDPDFVCRLHGLTRAKYDELIDNIRRTVAMKRQEGSNMQIEILILMYEGSYQTMEQTIETARQLGATRVLINSTVDKPELRSGGVEQEAAIRRVAERVARGDYGDLVVEIDPALETSILAVAQPVDLQQFEPAIGKFGGCMKNIVGLTPVITADGTFHVCFPCSQPPVANKGGIFKIGHILQEPFLALMERMKGEYRGIDIERDCSPDCRDILYFNAIIRKVIEDWILGIPLAAQPFFDRTTAVGTMRNPMHQEGYRVQTGAQDRIAKAAESVYLDKVSDFNHVTTYLQEIGVGNVAVKLEAGVPVVLLDKYEIPNLFEMSLVIEGESVYAYSYELGLVYSVATGKTTKFGEEIEGAGEQIREMFQEFNALKTSGLAYSPHAAPSGLEEVGRLKQSIREKMLLAKYAEWPEPLVTAAYAYYKRAIAGEVRAENPDDANNGIVLMTLFEQEAAKSLARKQEMLKRLHAYLLQLASVREFCRDFVNIYKRLTENGYFQS
ncbi:MAG: radical SAM protein [Candidatus Saganbacteria bacterium]|nr:radical SAM protein [Candidatus Saganbacteria bacterium]